MPSTLVLPLTVFKQDHFPVPVHNLDWTTNTRIVADISISTVYLITHNLHSVTHAIYARFVFFPVRFQLIPIAYSPLLSAVASLTIRCGYCPTEVSIAKACKTGRHLAGSKPNKIYFAYSVNYVCSHEINTTWSLLVNIRRCSSLINNRKCYHCYVLIEDYVTDLDLYKMYALYIVATKCNDLLSYLWDDKFDDIACLKSRIITFLSSKMRTRHVLK